MNPRIQPVVADSIHWLVGNREQAELRCPVCRRLHRNSPLLEIPSLDNGSTLTLYGCSACGSKFYDPPGIRDFSDILGNGANFWKSYVEVVGGIWEMYWPAACSTRKTAASLLDVGCGFGFTVDAWRRMRGEAIGVELADYGRAGAEQLGVLIYSDYLQNIPALQTRRFDVVYASEVIEHVPDPRAFALLLSRYVADDGVLCLTTPNADFICEQHASPTLVAALCPGFHGFLISPAEMEQILRACGFSHVLVRQFGERLIAWASRRPLEINETSPPIRAEYLGYLATVLADRKENDFVTDGIAYRYFRDALLAGHVDAARGALERLESSLREKYQPAPLDPGQTLARVQTLVTAEDYGAVYPWFLPNFYYFRGIYAKHSEQDVHAARQYFRASRELTAHIASRWGDMFVLEALSLVPDAWQQEAVSAALEGDPSVCVEWIAAIAKGRLRATPAFGGNKLSSRQLEQAYMEGLAILGALNRPQALGMALDDCLAYLTERYGDWLRAGQIELDGIPGSGLEHGHRMLLHMKIASACTQTGTHSELIRPLLERVVRLGDMQDTSLPMVRALAADARARLAALSPNSNPWRTVNAGTTQGVSYSFRYVPNSKS